jgi:hypothetical protein
MKYLKFIVLSFLFNFTNAFYWSVKVDKIPNNGKNWINISIIEYKSNPNFIKSKDCVSLGIKNFKDYKEDDEPYIRCDFPEYNYPLIKIKLDNKTQELSNLYSPDNIYKCYIMNNNINSTIYTCENI